MDTLQKQILPFGQSYQFKLLLASQLIWLYICGSTTKSLFQYKCV